MKIVSSYSSSSSSSSSSGDANHESNSNAPPPPPPPPPPPNLRPLQQHDPDQRQPLTLPPVVPLSQPPPRDGCLLHLSIPVTHPSLPQTVNHLLGQARLAMVNRSVKASFTTLSTFHISISRPTIIPSSKIPEVVAHLRHAISNLPSAPLSIQHCVRAFESKNKRRVYVAAPVASVVEGDVPGLAVFHLIDVVNRVFSSFNLPPHFDDPKPHMSFAWTDNMDILPLFESSETVITSSKQAPILPTPCPDSIQIDVRTVSCTMGASCYNFMLRNTTNQRNKSKMINNV